MSALFKGGFFFSSLNFEDSKNSQEVEPKAFILLHECNIVQQSAGTMLQQKYATFATIEKSRGEGSLMEQDTIENVS